MKEKLLKVIDELVKNKIILKYYAIYGWYYCDMIIAWRRGVNFKITVVRNGMRTAEISAFV